MVKIGVIGSTNMDYVCNVDEFVHPGQTILSSSFSKTVGGKGCNQAVACQKLGGETTFYSVIGNDDNGQTIIDMINDYQINSPQIETSKNNVNGLAFIQKDSHGENCIVVASNSNNDVTIEYIDRHLDSILSNDMIMIQLEIPLETTYHIIEVCYQHNVPVYLNPAPAVKLDAKYVAMLDTITPNKEELSIITGLPVDTEQQIQQACQHLLDLGVSQVIVTLGSKGCYYASKKETLTVSSFKVKAIDSVAAGDCFNGAFVVEYFKTHDLKHSLTFANGAAGIAVSTIGSATSIPSYSQVTEFLKNHE